MSNLLFDLLKKGIGSSNDEYSEEENIDDK
jgi:hypothetical protein